MKYIFTYLLTLFTIYCFGQNDSLCSVVISLDSFVNPVQLIATATGTPPFTYDWSNGERGDTIIPNGTSWHTVTITDGDGCANYDKFYYINHDSTNHLIEGSVFNSYDSTKAVALTGTAYLYQQAANSTYELRDSTSFISNGFRSPFSFGEVEPGIYIIQAVLSPDSENFAITMPTYYRGRVQWEEATSIFIPYSGTQTFDIPMYRKRDTEGGGIISGVLTLTDNFSSNSQSRNNDALAGYTVLLQDDENRPISSTFTDELGQFNFEDLPFGKYTILVEKTSYSSEVFSIELSVEHPIFKALNFIVDHSKRVIVSHLLTNTTEPTTETIKIFPNPSHSLLFIKSPEKIVEIQLFDCYGRTIKVISNQNEVDLSPLAKGMYFINIQTKSKYIYSEKVIKY